MKKPTITTTFILLAILLPFLATAGRSKKKIDKEFYSRTTLLKHCKWVDVDVQEKISFNRSGKEALDARLLITNDKLNLYLLLIIYDDDFYHGKDNGKWADDRLSVVFDENADKEFTDGDEDRISIFTREFAKIGEAHCILKAARGDWYYENKEKKWEYSQEREWEEANIPNQMNSPGPDVKEVNFFYTGELTNGEEQNFAFEMKIPIDAKDPYDLQSKPGDLIRIGISYGNLRDGYGRFPPGCNPHESPTGLFRYRLMDD